MINIILEGPDYSGKTTVAKLLATKLDYPIVHNGQHAEDAISINNEQMIYDHQLYYSGVIIDRHLMSDIVYSEINNRKPLYDKKVAHNIIRNWLRGDTFSPYHHANYIIVLNPTIDVIIRNAKKRDHLKIHQIGELAQKSGQLMVEYEKEAWDLNMQHIIVISYGSEMTPEHLAYKILEKIGGII